MNVKEKTFIPNVTTIMYVVQRNYSLFDRSHTRSQLSDRVKLNWSVGRAPLRMLKTNYPNIDFLTGQE